jgi:hypothetical protein
MEENKMALSTNVQEDARRRAGEGDGSAAPRHDGARFAGYRHLAHLLEKSAQTLRHASENVESRGLKLLLKVLAQERVAMFNALRQAVGKTIEDPLDPEHKSAATSLEEGLEDIQASMTVQRQGREKITLTYLLEEEEELLAAYNAAFEEGTAGRLAEMLESQRAHVAQFTARLRSVGAGIEPIVARVFDTDIEGERAIGRLRDQGLDESQIDAAPITRLAEPVLRTSGRANPRQTMGAGAFGGALVGGLVGLALAAFVWMAPQLVGWVTVGPWALLLGSIAIGVVFGTVFGFFIGQNQREDDLSVTADGLINGEILVVAYPQPNQVAMAEDVLQVHHGRELNR